MKNFFFKTSSCGLLLFFVSLYLLAVASLALATSSAQPESPALLAQRVQERYRNVQSMAADYQRSSSFVSLGAQSGGREVVGSGHLIWARPLKLRLDQEKPRREMIITGGGEAWWVRPGRKQADLYPFSQFTSGLTSLLDALGGLSGLERDYKVGEASVKERDAAPAGSALLSLEPRQQRADLKELVLIFAGNDLTLRGFVIYNLVGDRTAYSFSTLQINPAVNPALFDYEPPADYRLVDHRPIMGTKDPQAK